MELLPLIGLRVEESGTWTRRFRDWWDKTAIPQLSTSSLRLESVRKAILAQGARFGLGSSAAQGVDRRQSLQRFLQDAQVNRRSVELILSAIP